LETLPVGGDCVADQQNCCCGNQEVQQYFNSLPKMIQETIKQSGTKIQTLEELKQIEQQLTQK
jgi:hypothetical protein